MRDNLMKRLLRAKQEDFQDLVAQVYAYQVRYNPLYRRYTDLLGRLNHKPSTAEDIPYLPIALYKTHLIQTSNWQPAQIFTSSGTTGSTTSRHAVRDSAWYDHISRKIFETHYGDLREWTIFALLPSYLERTGSSLVHMVSKFMEVSGNGSEGGFFLDNFNQLAQGLQRCQKAGRKTLLIGVSFGLLDLADRFPMDLSGVTIMETGGMKGRRREMTRSELHGILCNAFNVGAIHSEYGMTELFSQAYACEEGHFQPGFTMQVLPREVTDPLQSESFSRTAALNIIDLANIDTCSFIATDDLGRCYQDGSFEVLGRMDGSDIRGCNLMVADMKSN